MGIRILHRIILFYGLWETNLVSIPFTSKWSHFFLGLHIFKVHWLWGLLIFVVKNAAIVLQWPDIISTACPFIKQRHWHALEQSMLNATSFNCLYIWCLCPLCASVLLFLHQSFVHWQFQAKVCICNWQHSHTKSPLNSYTHTHVSHTFFFYEIPNQCMCIANSVSFEMTKQCIYVCAMCAHCCVHVCVFVFNYAIHCMQMVHSKWKQPSWYWLARFDSIGS